MRSLKLLSALVLIFVVSTLQAQSIKDKLQGSWKSKKKADGREVTQLLLVSGDFFSLTEYASVDGDFISTKGGSWKADGDEIVLTVEFDTKNADQVGEEETAHVKVNGKNLKSESEYLGSTGWFNLDKGASTALTNPWLITGRERDGEITRRTGDSPRKTMKILTGTHFQWIAFNTETGEFFGTGGGSYSAKDDVYTENIKFFSRDKSRVGASLSFNFEVEGKDWHHKGKSSKGDPIYEIWSVREIPAE